MDTEQQRAVLTLCLLAAFADGANDDRERGQIKRIADTLDAAGPVDVAATYQQVTSSWWSRRRSDCSMSWC